MNKHDKRRHKKSWMTAATVLTGAVMTTGLVGTVQVSADQLLVEANQTQTISQASQVTSAAAVNSAASTHQLPLAVSMFVVASSAESSVKSSVSNSAVAIQSSISVSSVSSVNSQAIKPKSIDLATASSSAVDSATLSSAQLAVTSASNMVTAASSVVASDTVVLSSANSQVAAGSYALASANSQASSASTALSAANSSAVAASSAYTAASMALNQLSATTTHDLTKFGSSAENLFPATSFASTKTIVLPMPSSTANSTQSYMADGLTLNSVFLSDLNVFRSLNGQSALSYSATMDSVATVRVTEIQSYFSHTSAKYGANAGGYSEDILANGGVMDNMLSEQEMAFYMVMDWVDESDNPEAIGNGHYGHLANLLYAGPTEAIEIAQLSSAVSSGIATGMDVFAAFEAPQYTSASSYNAAISMANSTTKPNIVDLPNYIFKYVNATSYASLTAIMSSAALAETSANTAISSASSAYTSAQASQSSASVVVSLAAANVNSLQVKLNSDKASLASAQVQLSNAQAKLAALEASVPTTPVYNAKLVNTLKAGTSNGMIVPTSNQIIYNFLLLSGAEPNSSHTVSGILFADGVQVATSSTQLVADATGFASDLLTFTFDGTKHPGATLSTQLTLN